MQHYEHITLHLFEIGTLRFQRVVVSTTTNTIPHCHFAQCEPEKGHTGGDQSRRQKKNKFLG